MSDTGESNDAVSFVRAHRLATAGDPKEAVPERVCVIEEAPLTIDVDGVESYTILCTPTDRRALAVGFLFSEGLLRSAADIETLEECDDDPCVVRLRIKADAPKIDGAGRNLLIVSSCGACGSEDLRRRLDALPRVGETFRIPPSILSAVNAELRGRQSVFEACGAAHAAAVFDEKGWIISLAEDVGRHNALDKAVGKCLLLGERTAGRAVAVTSRLSVEMVSKCARAGIELVAAVSAPTSLAIEVADKCNITLCAFVRESRATAFTRPERVAEGLSGK